MGDWFSSIGGGAKTAGAAGAASGAASGATAAAPAASGFVNDYYKPFIAGGQQNFSEAWKNKGNNPQTYGYIGKKLEDFSKMAPPLPPAQMASMPGGQTRRGGAPEDSFSQLMRLRRGR